MQQFSGAEWDLEYVEPEPMGHEWGDHTTSHGAYDPFPFEALADPAASSVAVTSPVTQIAAPRLGDDFGGGSQDVDPDDAFSDELADDVDSSSTRMDQDPEAEVALLDMSEIDPFDAFDGEFALGGGDFQVEVPQMTGLQELEELVES